MGRPALHTGCSVEGCEGRHVARGFCFRHWSQARARGDFIPDDKRGRWTTCEVEGCNEPFYEHVKNDPVGYCRNHAARVRRNGHPDLLSRGEPCAVEGCERLTKRPDGRCSAHWYVPKPPRPTCVVEGCSVVPYKEAKCWAHLRPPRVRPRRGPVCTLYGCDAPHKALGLCFWHWRNLRQHGDPRGKPNSVLVEGVWMLEFPRPRRLDREGRPL